MLEVAVVPLNQNPLVVASKIFKDARHALRYHGAHVGGGGRGWKHTVTQNVRNYDILYLLARVAVMRPWT